MTEQPSPNRSGETSTGTSGAVLEMDERTARRRLSDNQPTTALGKMRRNLFYMRGRGAVEITVVYALILLLFLALFLHNSDPATGFPFWTRRNFSGTLTQTIPFYALLAIGAGILMIAGEFDLSLGASLGFAGVVFIKTLNAGYAWPLAVLAAVASSVGIALVNGVIVVATQIPSFIATLGMSFFWNGAALYVNGLSPAIIAEPNSTMTNIMAGDHGWFRSQLIWMIVIGFVAWWFLHRTKWGNHIYATGGNAAAAKAVSIKPNSVRLLSFAILGLMVGLAAALLVARTTTMQPATTDARTLFAIAAAVVGGCSLTGGRGTLFGMIIGAALIGTVENGFILGRLPGFYLQLFLGVTIVIAATINKVMEGRAT
ncbi:MAG TPA: ABC transporter permease [Mycobacteriales bacterium]|nr:ABC transporter permease [Mycobacteriales bacterium]